MPVTVKRYRCKECGREYDVYAKAKNCEDSHPKPVAVRTAKYTVKPFPYEVEVVFDDGTRRIYCSRDLGGG